MTESGGGGEEEEMCEQGDITDKFFLMILVAFTMMLMVLDDHVGIADGL